MSDGVQGAMKTTPSTAKAVVSRTLSTGITTMYRIVLTASHATSQSVTTVTTVTSTESMATTASVKAEAEAYANLAGVVALSTTTHASLT